MHPSLSPLKLAVVSVIFVLGCTCTSLGQSRKAKKDTLGVSFDMKLIQRNYCYPTFITSTVTFHDSSFVKAPLNYNMLLREMHFITEEGDTLALANGAGIARIRIEEDQFQFAAPYGFLWIVESFKNLNLSAQLMTTPKVVGRGTLANAVMLAEDKDSTGNTRIRDMRGQTIFVRNTNYFLVDKNNTPYKVSKPNLLKLYPNLHREINQYLKKNTNSLNNTKELSALLKYCDQLTVQ